MIKRNKRQHHRHYKNNVKLLIIPEKKFGMLITQVSRFSKVLLEPTQYWYRWHIKVDWVQSWMQSCDLIQMRKQSGYLCPSENNTPLKGWNVIVSHNRNLVSIAYYFWRVRENSFIQTIVHFKGIILKIFAVNHYS